MRAVEEIGIIMTIEDHNITGGLGSAVAEVVAELGKGLSFKRMGLKDFSVGYGTYAQVKEMNGIGLKQICNEVKQILR